MKYAAILIALMVVAVGAVALDTENTTDSMAVDGPTASYMVYKQTSYAPSYQKSPYYYKSGVRDYTRNSHKSKAKRVLKKVAKGLALLYIAAFALGLLLLIWLKVFSMKKKVCPKGWKKLWK